MRNDEMRGSYEIPEELQKLTVSEVLEKKKGFINPVIVTFQNGELNEQHASKCKVSFRANSNGETKVEVTTSCGHVFKDGNCSEKPRPKGVIAIRNKKTNKVKLVEVDYVALINSALLTSSQTDEPPPVSATENKAKTLNKTFGGKKAMNRLMEREKLNLSSLPIADEVKKAVEDITVEGNMSLNTTETDSILHLLPPCHRDSKVLSNVYKLDEILSEEELEALKEEVSKNEQNFKSEEFSPFVKYCYSEGKDCWENLDKLAGLLFIDSLIKFLKMSSKKIGTKTVVLCPFSPIIHEKIRNEFCVKTETSVTRPITMRDKTLCYIITLSLICCNYQINLKLLATSTSVHFNKLTRLAQVVGAVPLDKEGLFILKVPLPALPKSSKGRLKRN